MTTTPEPPTEVEHVDHSWINDGYLLGSREESFSCAYCGKRRRVRYQCPGNDDAPQEVTGL